MDDTRERWDRVNRFLSAATGAADVSSALEVLCAELVAAGAPLWRVAVSYPTLDPIVRARSRIWWRDRALTDGRATHEEEEAQFRRSPIRHLRERELTFGRWRLERGEGQGFLLLRELRAEGGTEYVLHIVGFGAASAALPGAALSFATDRPGGFTDGELAEIAAAVPALGLASCRAALAEVASSLLEVYLGARTAGHVLKGEVRPGHGRTIEAAILLADLRGFTRLADGADPLRVVAWLDQHLDAMAGAVAEEGGEILKFLGDGLLAIFPVPEGGTASLACERAWRAAEAALARNAAVNAARERAGAPTLALDVALHHGEVVYGNVGSARRLDFTAVGRAVNEASRIEALCAVLDRPLLLSAEFARRCGRPTRSLGFHLLRGLDRPREIHAPRAPGTC